MENSATNDATEEIVIVASCYGELRDVIIPLCEKGEPIEREELVKLIGGEEMYLNPRDNKYDAFAVGVYTVTQKLLGYVWMQQAPSVRRWMAENGKSFLAVKIDRFNTQTGLMMAKPTLPMQLVRVTRSEGIDDKWAKDLPLVITDIKQQGLEMGLFVLKEKLEVLTEWDDSLKPMLENVFRYLETDLSDYCYGECIDAYNAMRKSPIKVVREKADLFLKALVNRGSEDRTMWWIDEWLPNFMKEAKGSDLLGIYEKSGYTLEMVEELLNDAPMHLYQMYDVNKPRFAKQLYYSALPPQIFYRLITLLTLKESMKGNEGRMTNDEKEIVIDNKVLKKAVAKVKPFMWAASAYAVLYCVCRDLFGYSGSISQFEREIECIDDTNKAYDCKKGTIINANRNNSYYKYNVESWEKRGAKEKVLILRDRFKEAMEDIMQENRHKIVA